MGYLVTGYHFFFSDPDSVIANQIIWYTNLAGAFWDACFGSLGLVAFTFAHAVLVWATAAICYVGLRARVHGRVRLLIILACTVAYVCGARPSPSACSCSWDTITWTGPALAC